MVSLIKLTLQDCVLYIHARVRLLAGLIKLIMNALVDAQYTHERARAQTQNARTLSYLYNAHTLTSF